MKKVKKESTYILHVFTNIYSKLQTNNFQKKWLSGNPWIQKGSYLKAN